MTIRTFEFGKINYHNPSGRKINLVTAEVSLRTDRRVPVFSASMGVWNGNHTDYVAVGQMFDEIKHVPENDALFQEIKKLWKLYHLHPMHAIPAKDMARIKKIMRS